MDVQLDPPLTYRLLAVHGLPPCDCEQPNCIANVLRRNYFLVVTGVKGQHPGLWFPNEFRMSRN